MPLYVLTIQFTAVPADVEPALARHGEHLRRLEAEGRLQVAASLARDEGLLEIFRARDRMDAESTARSHPLVEAAVAVWTLRELEPLHGLGED